MLFAGGHQLESRSINHNSIGAMQGMSNMNSSLQLASIGLTSTDGYELGLMHEDLHSSNVEKQRETDALHISEILKTKSGISIHPSKTGSIDFSVNNGLRLGSSIYDNSSIANENKNSTLGSSISGTGLNTGSSSTTKVSHGLNSPLNIIQKNINSTQSSSSQAQGMDMYLRNGEQLAMNIPLQMQLQMYAQHKQNENEPLLSALSKIQGQEIAQQKSGSYIGSPMNFSSTASNNDGFQRDSSVINTSNLSTSQLGEYYASLKYGQLVGDSGSSIYGLSGSGLLEHANLLHSAGGMSSSEAPPQSYLQVVEQALNAKENSTPGNDSGNSANKEMYAYPQVEKLGYNYNQYYGNDKIHNFNDPRANLGGAEKPTDNRAEEKVKFQFEGLDIDALDFNFIDFGFENLGTGNSSVEKKIDGEYGIHGTERKSLEGAMGGYINKEEERGTGLNPVEFQLGKLKNGISTNLEKNVTKGYEKKHNVNEEKAQIGDKRSHDDGKDSGIHLNEKPKKSSIRGESLKTKKARMEYGISEYNMKRGLDKKTSGVGNGKPGVKGDTYMSMTSNKE
ncbi:hypothetical protein BB560_000351 [Smittium megazygosporum]|uniref:Uncharacterized protein n=1 Tax=Smittium megazygosporum TaxID=133381 RepID=A0A2T9ZKN3_9FUNG|nr:hypothetical protein BB560_000351 [Smittium megazygosporum]